MRVTSGELKDEAADADDAMIKPLAPGAGLSAWMFLAAVILVVFCGLFPVLRKVGPSDAPVTVTMPQAIAMVMLTVAAAMLLFCGAKAGAIVKTKTCQAGITAIVGILGLAW